MSNDNIDGTTAFSGVEITADVLKEVKERIDLIGTNDIVKMLFDDGIDIYSQHVADDKIFVIKNPNVTFPNSKGRVVWLVPADRALKMYRDMRILGVNVRLDPKEALG